MSNIRIRNLKGEGGAVVRTGTTPATGQFDALQCIEPTVLASITSNLSGDSLVGVTLPAGFVLYANITAFTLTSGKVIAYRQL